MKQYRVPFFLELEKILATLGVRLTVVYGTPWRGEAARGDHADLPAPLGHGVNSSMLLGKVLVIPVLRTWLAADLVVVEHANKNLLNYLLAALQRFGLKRLAYWSHGRDRQADPQARGERFKRRSLHWANWWFAYTDDAGRYVAQQGFDPARITVVQNAIDTRELRGCLADVTDAERSQLRDELGWPANCRIAIYCGSLYENKRFDLLMESADSVHQHHPAFRLLIVGGGPMSKQIEAYARQRSWVYWAGPKFGREKAAFLSLAEMWLNPGLVGLGILDAFCARLPLLTTDLPLHSPEIEYLEPGINGLITAPQASAFAEAIESLLNHSAKLGRMRAAAEAASHRYSIETMAQNFATGVERCLGLS